MQENSGHGEISIEWIKESKQPELAEQYDYYYVPTFLANDNKLYEAHPSEDYAACKKNVKAALDAVINKD